MPAIIQPPDARGYVAKEEPKELVSRITYLPTSEYNALTSGLIGVTYEDTQTAGRPQKRWDPVALAFVSAGSGDVGGLSTAQVQALIDSNSELGEAQVLIDQAIVDYNPTVQAKIDQSIAGVANVNIDSQSFTSIQAALNYLNSKIPASVPTPSAPVPNAAPSITFVGGTGDVNETATITPGSYTVATPSAVSWNVMVNGVFALNTTSVNFVIPAVAGTGARQMRVDEVFSWTGASGVTGKSSATYTINAPAAVPVQAPGSPPTITVSGTTATGVHGLYSNTPLSFTQRWVDAVGTVLGTATTLDLTALGGKSITFKETPSNAAGAGLESSSAPITVSGGTAPTYDGGVEPGWVAGTFAVGTPMVLDLGVAINGLQSVDVQVLRAGVPATNAGAAATGVTSFSYTPISLDETQPVAVTVVPRNAAGAGPAITVPAVIIGPAVSGGGGSGTISFVGLSSTGSTNAIATASMPIASGALAGDYCILVGTENNPTDDITTPSGWTATASGKTSVATPEGQMSRAWVKALGASEAAFTITGTTDYKAFAMAAFRGATRVVAEASSVNTTSNTSPVTITFPSVTTDAANQTIALVCVLDPTGTGAVAVWDQLPAGFTVRVNTYWDGTAYGHITIIEGTVAAIGATGTFTARATLAAGNAGWMARTIALGT